MRSTLAQAEQAMQVPSAIADEQGGLRRGRFAILNDRQTIASLGGAATFTFEVPSVKTVYIVEATYVIVEAQDTYGWPFAGVDPAQILVESISFQRVATTDEANIILDGSPTARELFGKGILPRLFTRIIELNPHQRISMVLRNNDTKNAVVSVTLYIETSGV